MGTWRVRPFLPGGTVTKPAKRSTSRHFSVRCSLQRRPVCTLTMKSARRAGDKASWSARSSIATRVIDSAGKYAMRPPDSCSFSVPATGFRSTSPAFKARLKRPESRARYRLTAAPLRARPEGDWPRWRSSSTRSSWDGVIALSQWSPSRDTSQVISVRMVLYDRRRLSCAHGRYACSATGGT